MDAGPNISIAIPRQWRRADRRAGLDQLLRHVAADLVNANDRRHLSNLLMDRLRQLAGMRGVGLKEITSARPPRSVQPIRARDYVAFAVPVKEEGRQVMLEASFDARHGPDDWTCQLIEAGASIAAVLLETERLACTPAPLTTAERDGAAPLIGSSEAMRLLRERVERVANTNFTVLIEGESGVGKELVARQIHELGPRRQGPFVAINCAALVETLIEAELFGIEERTATGVRGRRGKFEHADGGTLFLDEISDLSAAAQAKLLRVIQDLTVERVGGSGPRQINTRIVAATNRPLAGLVDRALFRTDLFYRLSGVEIRVPPLRVRKGDILELTQYFLSRHEGRGRLTMTAAAVDALIAYDWPGNVRELERMIEGRNRHRRIAADSRRRSAGQPSRRIRRAPGPVVPGGRHDAGVGQPLCAARPRKERRQQAPGLSRARHQLSHAQFVLAVSACEDAARHRASARAGVVAELTNGLPEASGGEDGEAGRKGRAVMRLLRSKSEESWCEGCR
jgi:DNA-binding NtrC family response regulator